MHSSAAATIFICGCVIIAAEWTGQRRQELLVRVMLGMLFLLYAYWKFAAPVAPKTAGAMRLQSTASASVVASKSEETDI